MFGLVIRKSRMALFVSVCRSRIQHLTYYCSIDTSLREHAQLIRFKYTIHREIKRTCTKKTCRELTDFGPHDVESRGSVTWVSKLRYLRALCIGIKKGQSPSMKSGGPSALKPSLCNAHKTQFTACQNMLACARMVNRLDFLLWK